MLEVLIMDFLLFVHHNYVACVVYHNTDNLCGTVSMIAYLKGHTCFDRRFK